MDKLCCIDEENRTTYPYLWNLGVIFGQSDGVIALLAKTESRDGTAGQGRMLVETN